MRKRILVLGGGIGGLVVSSTLSRNLNGEHEIVLVDRNERHVFAPSLLWMLLGWRKPKEIMRSLMRLKAKNIIYRRAEVLRIDTSGSRVQTSVGGFPYDYLVVALGADLAPEKVGGFAETACNMYDIDGVTRLRERLHNFEGGRVVILVSSTPFKCPAAPYETAFLLDYYFSRKGVRKYVDIQVFTPETLPMPVAGPEIGNKIRRMLADRDIGFNPEHKVSYVDGQRQTLIFDGKEAHFDLLVGVPPHIAPIAVRDSGLTDSSGWIPVDPATLRTVHENVYAIGDVAGISLPDGKMLPKAGVFGHFEAEVVAHNIASEIKGKHALREFDGNGSCFLETGYGKAGYASGNFFSQPRIIKMRNPSRIWHWSKVLFEKYWFWRWFS